MSLLREWARRLLGTIRRGRSDRDLEEELRVHAELAAEEARRTDHAAGTAVRAARLRHGGLPQAIEAMRDQRGVPWLRALGRDVRGGVRALRATPGFTIVALVVLTLGIGASTAVFSVVDAVVLRALPFDRAERLVAVREVEKTGALTATSPQNFLDWRSRQTVFTGLAAMTSGSVNLERDGRAAPESLQGSRVTANFFQVLRVAPLKGRLFTPADEVEGHDRVAIVSYGLWQRRFGGTPDVIGRHLPADDGDLEVVGVMPPGFDYPPASPVPKDIWTPYVIPPGQRTRSATSHYWTLQLVARLRDGVSVRAAQSDLDRITAALMAATPSWFSGMTGVRVEPLRDALTDGVRTWMVLLLGAVAFVLALACVNVANLLLVRATTRVREVSLRAALGATRGDLVRARLVESLLLSVIGALLGCGAAWFGVDVLRRAMPETVPRAAAIAVNLRVLGAAVAAAVGTGLLSGLVPALTSSRPDVNSALRNTGRAETPDRKRLLLQNLLVGSEVALAVVLTVGSALFTASFARVTRVDLGMDVDHVLTVRILPPPDAVHKRVRMLDIADRVGHLPGIDVGSVSGFVPMWGGTASSSLYVAGQPPGSGSMADRREVSPGLFRALRIPLLAGRPFEAGDQTGPPVCILDAAAATAVFGGVERAVGRSIFFEGERTVVGVVGDIRQWGPERAARNAAYIPFAQSDMTWGTLLLRTSAESGTILPAIRAAIASEFPDAIVPTARPLQSFLAGRLASRRFNMLLLGLFGLLGVVIAALGVYGVLAHVVTRRTREIGIRMALGAAPANMVRSVLTRAAVVVGVGILAGLCGAWSLANMVETFLFHVQVHDLAIYGVAAGVLITASMGAALLPARRAAHVDPIAALRAE